MQGHYLEHLVTGQTHLGIHREVREHLCKHPTCLYVVLTDAAIDRGAQYIRRTSATSFACASSILAPKCLLTHRPWEVQGADSRPQDCSSDYDDASLWYYLQLPAEAPRPAWTFVFKTPLLPMGSSSLNFVIDIHMCCAAQVLACIEVLLAMIQWVGYIIMRPLCYEQARSIAATVTRIDAMRA